MTSTGRLLSDSRLFVALSCLVLPLLAGCAGSSPSTSTEVTPNRTWSPEEAEDKLRAAARRWRGAPHEWGGTSRHGVDCSGLVQSVYAEAFDLGVPRTTAEQARTGQTVDRSSLRPGDLVFFRPEGKTRHVGIYLSDGEFLHASSSSGVAVSELDRPYWTDRWWQARRLLSASSTPASDSSEASRSESTAPSW